MFIIAKYSGKDVSVRLLSHFDYTLFLHTGTDCKTDRIYCQEPKLPGETPKDR